MAKPEWGAKRVCQNCGTKFYDFLRNPILCPSCGATYQPDDALKPRRSRVEPKSRAAPKPAPVEEEDEAAEEEEADDVLLDEADEEDEVEEAIVEDDEDEEAEGEVKTAKPARDPLIPDDDVEDDDALDEEVDEDDLDEEDVDEDFVDDEK